MFFRILLCEEPMTVLEFVRQMVAGKIKRPPIRTNIKMSDRSEFARFKRMKELERNSK